MASIRRRSPSGGAGIRSPIAARARRNRSPHLSIEDEALIVAFRRHTLLPLDDCLYALQATLPHLTRSSLHRCLQRHGISQLPEVDGTESLKSKFKAYPIGFFHIDIAEVRTEQGHAARRRTRRRGRGRVDHRLTKPKHPWSNGQVGRMNRTIKDGNSPSFPEGAHAL